MTSSLVCLSPPPTSPGLQQGVQRCQRQAAERQFAAEPVKKAEEVDTEKVENEECETIGKNAAEVQPIEVKTVEDKLAEQDTYEKVTTNETAHDDQTEKVSKSEDTIVEKGVNELKNEFCSYESFREMTKGLFNQPTAPTPVAPPP